MVPTSAMLTTDLSLRKPINATVLSLNDLSELSDPRNRSIAFYGSEHEVTVGTVRLRHAALTTAVNPAGWVGFPRLIPPDDFVAPANPGPGPFAGDDTPGDMGEFGQYVVVYDLLGFDVRIFDPEAPILRVNTTDQNIQATAPAIVPGDPGFYGADVGGVAGIRNARTASPGAYVEVGQGAFVDLGYMVNRNSANFADMFDNSISDTAAIGRPFTTLNGDTMGRMSTFSGLPSFRDVAATSSGDPVTDLVAMNNSEGNEQTDETKFWPSVVDQVNGEWAGSQWDWDASGFDVNAALDEPEEMDRPIIVYDTWTTAFEHDGFSQDDDDNDSVLDLPGNRDTDEQADDAFGNVQIDEGRDGRDSPIPSDGTNSKSNGVDDVEELESPAPYPVPARGIEVRVRMWDVSTGQVRQVSVVGDFTN